MPAGIPVATVAIDGAANAALLAIEILALSSPELTIKLESYRTKLQEKVLKSSV
jgi:5-(carboxyamino)imidazole ribonucleotide mutase